MLGKLLKYEIPATGRKILPLYAAWAAAALFLGLSLQSAETKTEFFAIISALLYIALATAIMVMTIILIVQRFSRSLLGDEAYFNHVLPVTAAEHISNKLISATLWVLITIVVAIITALLIALGALIAGAAEGLTLTELLRDLEIHIPNHFALYTVETVILIVASTVKMVMQIYAAVTVGHQTQNHTTLASIGTYILILMFESSIARILMPLVSKIDYDAVTTMTYSKIFLIGVIADAAFSAIYFFICKYLMEKRLNIA